MSENIDGTENLGALRGSLPDLVERGTSRCEDWYFDNVLGNDMRCCCGKTCRLEDALAVSPDPYAIPVCPECFESAMEVEFGSAWRDKV